MFEHTTKKDRSWLLPVAQKVENFQGLYVISTPIGNLRDISIRALDTLAGVDIIACEDTRVSGKLLSYYDISKPLVSYNDHNAPRARPQIMEVLSNRGSVALISDAGTPLINDPGFKLIADCFEHDIGVTSVPGANAPLTALQLSGLPSDQFCFLGFLPSKQGARAHMLKTWGNVEATLIAFETGPRLLTSLKAIFELYGERKVAVVRELTKMYEQSLRAPVSELVAYYEREGAPKGEIVLVIGAGESYHDDEAVERMVVQALKTMSTKEAAAYVAEITGRPKKELYALALQVGKS